METEIKTLLTELFELIGIKAEFKITEEKQEEGVIYKVEIDPGESAGLLIGSHGLTLAALQSFVAIAIKQKTGEWAKIICDVHDWGEKQKEKLVEMAHQTAERARQTGEAQKLYNLNSLQRRIIHMELSNETGIETTSEGEGQDRFLIVKVK